MKIVTIVGARPQFVKAAPVSRALRSAGHQEFLVHTGQHYDEQMSALFFRDLEIPEPDVNLGIGSASHARQTGQMLIRIEDVLSREKPDGVVVFGDTNSTLAGALAAVKLHIPVSHVEAGLRSFNRRMPEEHNRVLTDHMSDLLFCPTETAAKNLEQEGILHGVHVVGDVMYDSMLYNIKLAETRSQILRKFDLERKVYALATIHRADNTDDPQRLTTIFSALGKIAQELLSVVVPLHPRTRQRLDALHLSLNGLVITQPVSYLDMLVLEKNARIVITDSGGVQKESYWLRVPCVTLREETEWVETVQSGWNVIAGLDPHRIIKAVTAASPGQTLQQSKGEAAQRIVSLLSLL